MKLKHIGRSQRFEISYRSIKGWSQNWLKIPRRQVSVIWIVLIWSRPIVLKIFCLLMMPWKKGVKGREKSGFKKRHCLDVKDLLPVCNSIHALLIMWNIIVFNELPYIQNLLHNAKDLAMIAVLFSRKLFVINVYFDYKQIQKAYSAPS